MAQVTVDSLQKLAFGHSPQKKIGMTAYEAQIQPIFEKLAEEANVDTNVKFDPKKHLIFKPEYVDTVNRTTMAELGATSPKQISEIGVSEPFPLFSDEACDIMKAEVLKKNIFEKWARESMSSTTGLDAVIRGYARECAPFTYAAWTHPDTVAAVSAMAGVELEVIMPYEVAHINVSMKSEDAAINERMETRRRASMSSNTDTDVPAIVGWHNDSYPFVCVLMLSDTEGMIGGETLIKCPNGEIIAAEGPAKGKATVLQGRILVHLASKPLGFTERITSVTSYRAKDSTVEEGSVLSTVKPEVNYGSLYHKFYPEWVSYRMNVIKDRAQRIQDVEEATLAQDKDFDKAEAIKMLKDLEAYVHKTYKEMEVSEEEWQNYAKKAMADK